jgi:hypothetical protein
VPARDEPRPGSDGAPGAARELLLFGTPREVLARIVPEDPLGLRERIGARVIARALLLDVERVLLQAQALCSLRAAAWRGRPELDVWLDQRVEEALAAALSDEPGEAQSPEDLALFAAPLALEPSALARGCARFNRLPYEQREAFHAVVLDTVALDRLARARKLSLSELARRARAGLEVFRRGAHAAEGERPDR